MSDRKPMGRAVFRAKVRDAEPGEEIRYYVGETPSIPKAIFMEAYRAFGSGQVLLTQRRITQSSPAQSGNGVFEYLAIRTGAPFSEWREGEQ